MNEIDARERKMRNAHLSPISETDSNKYNTLDSHGQTVKRINPIEERKLTGTGTYNV